VDNFSDILTLLGRVRIAQFVEAYKCGIGMREMQDTKAGKWSGAGLVRALVGAALLAACALAAGCGTSVRTPLPDVGPVVPTSLSQAERTQAVEELNRKRATHEQDAELVIEQSR
jgi:hypothetical protein